MKALRVFLLLALCSTGLRAQDVTARLAGRVPPDVVTLVRQLAASAAARGLPVDPLIQKAIEGSAKGVPPVRIVTAVRGLVAQLDVAAAALRDAGSASPDTDAIGAGAFAVNAGLSGKDVTALAVASRSQSTVAATLRVASTLAAMGVPPAETVELVTKVIASGGSSADVLALPSQVMAGVSEGRGRGVTPAQAAAGLARAAAARANAPGQNKPKHGKP